MASRAAEEIRKAIEEENSRLERLCAETERSRRAIAVLQSELRSVDARVAPRASLPLFADAAPTTGAEKVRLFRRLFRGRDDVYPKLWTNAKKGTTGYAPACANEWIRDVCDKPRVKCGVCPNQEFLPVTDRVVLDHLRGHHVAGVYPILRDDTCWFLAADFDGPAWIDDVAAFADTCRRAGVPIAVERSRSGDGAHAWFFFAEPVPARIARSIGCHLLTETMSRRHTLGMASYDRLFPNQDMLPKGGFGNLIALPLQHAARARGNTVFLNDALVPFPDDQQWSYLASIRPIESSAANAVAREASRRGRVVAVQSTEGEPWKTPALESQRSGTLPSLPATVRAVLAQRLFVERTGLPEFALDAIRRIGAFQNPEFYKKQAMRLSTATTPRVISCTEEHDLHISLPRGCREELELFLREGKSHLEVRPARRRHPSRDEIRGFALDHAGCRRASSACTRKRSSRRATRHGQDRGGDIRSFRARP